MKQFDLSIYKLSQPYFDMFDVFLKERGIRKEIFLLDNDITPSTYRQCRKGEYNIGPKIINKMADKFSLKVPNDELVNEIEMPVNNIYFDMYYKNYKLYDYYQKRVDELLEENLIIFPTLELAKLYLKLSCNKSISKVVEDNEELFERIKKYQDFLKKGLFDLFELVYLSFEKNISEDCWIKNYNNASAYFILTSRSYMNKRYIETLFFASKCKEILFIDGNINRTIYLNNTIMSALIHVGNYEECYNLSFRQLKALESLDCQNQFLIDASNKFLLISKLGKMEYKEIIKKCLDDNNLLLTETLCLLIALYQQGVIDKNLSQYKKYYKKLEDDKLDEKKASIIIALNQYLNCKRKSLLNKLLDFEIMKHFEKILEKIVEQQN